jgi:hypothetical protein
MFQRYPHLEKLGNIEVEGMDETNKTPTLS